MADKRFPTELLSRTIRQMRIAKNILSLLLSLTLFIAISYLVQSRLVLIEDALNEATSKGMAMTLYVILGVCSVIVPFTSLIPVVPLAVALWGVPLTVVLTVLAWMVGGQILFELSHLLGRPQVERFVGKDQLESLGRTLQGKGLGRAIILRMMIQSDLLSVAFALFTKMSRAEFFIVNCFGVIPCAIAYAYFGVLPIAWQIAASVVVVIAAAAYWLWQERKPREAADFPEQLLK